MTGSRTVEFHLDFVSPYTWLALQEAAGFSRQHGVTWSLRPVVYAALLGAHGLVGPVEIEAKRRYTFHDLARCAAQRNLALAGPPAHPFRSLEALRTLMLFREAAAALDLAVALSDAAWGRGRDLTDTAVLQEVVAGVGLEADSLAERIAAPEVKAALRSSTEAAVQRGVFGVPTFEHEGELFWGHDRMAHLAARLDGRLGLTAGQAEKMLMRPRGIDRRGVPSTGSGR